MRAQTMESHKQVRGEINEKPGGFSAGPEPRKLATALLANRARSSRCAESGGTQLVFTYAELYRLCRVAADGGR